ncbi:MAG: hypothetical protein M0015_02795, partial [Betaproteobacteria bacterium]|nr:hypothetical protein [Betaproteobacteria bacterium]
MIGALDEPTFGRRARGHSALAYALIASATLHAVLFAALHGPRIPSQRGADPAPLVAFLETMHAAPVVAPRAAPPVARLEPKTRARAPKQRRFADAASARAAAARHETVARGRWTSRVGAEG